MLVLMSSVAWNDMVDKVQHGRILNAPHANVEQAVMDARTRMISNAL